MKNIKIRKDVKQRLEEFKESNELTSINKAMRLLLEDAEEHTLPDLGEKPFIGINLDDELLDKLKRCKMHHFETHSDTIDRLISEKNGKK